MHHDEGQLDILWDSLKGADAVTRQALLQRYANSQMPGVHPQVLCDDAEAQVLSVPSPAPAPARLCTAAGRQLG